MKIVFLTLAPLFIFACVSNDSFSVPQSELDQLDEEIERLEREMEDVRREREARAARFQALPDRPFGAARVGEYWVIKTAEVPLFLQPLTTYSDAEVRRLFIIALDSLTKVQIIGAERRRSLGIFGSTWFQLDVYNERDMLIFRGWVLDEVVKSAGRLPR